MAHAVRKVLVVDDDPLICEILADCLHDWPDTEVDCEPGGELAVQKLRAGHFDLALIDGTLAGISGIKLAEIAANEDTPVLFISGHPEVNEKLKQFGYPYLAKPFSLGKLMSESKQVIADAVENIRCVKASTARMLASADALKAAMDESRRLLEIINESASR